MPANESEEDALNSQAELVEKLVHQFRQLLDDAVILAIAGDHDLTRPHEADEVRWVLTNLAADAALEEVTTAKSARSVRSDAGVDASACAPVLSPLATAASSSLATSAVWSTPQGTASSASSDPVALSGSKDDAAAADDALAQLRDMFLDLKEVDVRNALRGANGSFDAALDVLLNLQFLESVAEQPKGVDAFFKPDDKKNEQDEQLRAGNGRKKNRRKKMDQQQPCDEELISSGLGEAEHTASIAYISERLDLPFSQVAVVYKQHHLNKASSAIAILKMYAENGVQAQDTDRQRLAAELVRKYRFVPEAYMPTIVQVAGFIPSWPEEIAGLLDVYFSKPPPERLAIDYSLTPIDAELATLDNDGKQNGDDDGFTLVTSRKLTPKIATGPFTPPLSPSRPREGSSSLSPSANASSPTATSANLYTQSRATAAYATHLVKRGALQPLMRQAAHIYAERSREQARQARAVRSQEADRLVERQSTVCSLDLHGVTVDDGVRIATAAVWTWWHDAKRRRGGPSDQDALADVFTIITGLGRHSANGVSRLRQSVASALAKDGWKFKVQTGSFVVLGRRTG